MKTKSFFFIFSLVAVLGLSSCGSGELYELQFHERALMIDSVEMRQDSVDPSKQEIAENQKMLANVRGKLLQFQPKKPLPLPDVDPPDGPIPPKPCWISSCLISIAEVDFILAQKELTDFNVVIMDNHGKVVGTLGKPDLDKYDDLDSYPLNISEKGKFKMEVSKFSKERNKPITYTLNVVR